MCHGLGTVNIFTEGLNFLSSNFTGSGIPINQIAASLLWNLFLVVELILLKENKFCEICALRPKSSDNASSWNCWTVVHTTGVHLPRLPLTLRTRSSGRYSDVERSAH